MRIIAYLICVMLMGCATNPVSGKKKLNWVGEAQEVAMGTKLFPQYRQMQGGDYILDPALSEYVNRVGQKVARVSHRPQLPYEFTILNMDEVNAWALPGGKIAINRGLLLKMKSESELAAVLAHEVVHAAAAHSAQRMSHGNLLQVGVVLAAVLSGEENQQSVAQLGSIGAGLVSMNYSRSDEREADFFSMNYMVDAGYDPIGAVSLQQTFVDLHGGGGGGWLSTHPSSSERVQLNRQHLADFQNTGYLGESEYRLKTRGLRNNEEAYRLYAEGQKAFAEEKVEAALQYADAALDLEPREAHFYALRGKALYRLGKTASAERAFNEAIDRNSRYFDYYLQRGILHKKKGRKERAISDLKTSWGLLPTEQARDALHALGVR